MTIQVSPSTAQRSTFLPNSTSRSWELDVKRFKTLLMKRELVIGMPANSDSWTGHASCFHTIKPNDPLYGSQWTGYCSFQELHQTQRDDPTFRSTIITGDYSLIYGCGPEKKQQSSQWKGPRSPKPKKAWQLKSKFKSLPLVLFYSKNSLHRIIQSIPLPLWRFATVQWKKKWKWRPEIWEQGNWLFRYENASCLQFLVHQDIFDQKSYDSFPWSSFSPDLTPCDSLNGISSWKARFDKIYKTQEETLSMLNTLRERDFQDEFGRWQSHWGRCLLTDGQ